MKSDKSNIKNLVFVCGVVLVAVLLVLSTMQTPESGGETAGDILQAGGNDEITFPVDSMGDTMEVSDEAVESPSEATDEAVEVPSEATDETAESPSEVTNEAAESLSEIPDESEGSAFEDLPGTTSDVPEPVEDILEGAQSAEWADVPPEQIYSFRNERLLNQHYEKHGIEMGFDTIEEYVAAANAVINHPDVLHKKEAEDNDDVYFLEATNEFVVVSTDGYIRTYFIASGGIAYYNRQ